MTDPLGVSPGQPNDPSAANLSNEFATIPDQSLDAIADRVQPRQVPSGVTRGIQQLGSDKVYSDGGNQQIIVEDSNEPRVLMGNHATFGEGFYVTKDGFNVKTNTSAANFIFNSSQNVFKIVLSGTTSITSPTSGSSNTITVAHNLGFVPIGMFYVNNSNQFVPLPWTLWGTTAGKGTGELTMFVQAVDSTNITFQIYNWNAVFNGTIFPIKYYLLQETAN